MTRYACPKCGESETLRCEVTVEATVASFAKGEPVLMLEDIDLGPIDGHERMTCGECDHSAEAWEFQVKPDKCDG